MPGARSLVFGQQFAQGGFVLFAAFFLTILVTYGGRRRANTLAGERAHCGGGPESFGFALACHGYE